jgi:hypothetical protein
MELADALHPHRFARGVRAAFGRLGKLAPDAAAAASVQSIAEVVMREADRELVGLRPRRLLLAALERIDAVTRLAEVVGAPRIVVQRAELAAIELIGPLAELTRSASGETLACFEAEPTTRATVDGVSLRYLDFWSTAGVDDVRPLEVDLSRPLLARLAADPELWAQQHEVLRAGTDVAWGSIAWTLEGDHALVPELGPLSPRALLALYDGIDDGSIDWRWCGARETPFVFGRLAHLLGPAPSSDGPSLALEITVDGTVGTASAHDVDGDGIPTMCVSGLSRAQADRFVAMLFASTQCADVETEGYHDGCGVHFRLGVRGGRLFAEAETAASPPWHVER